MRFSLQREVLLKPLAQVVNVVERRQTLPVLANQYHLIVKRLAFLIMPIHCGVKVTACSISRRACSGVPGISSRVVVPNSTR